MNQSLQGARILFLVVNDVAHDQRVFRITHTLQKAGAKVTVYGRELQASNKVNWEGVNIRRFKIHPSSGPLMYFNMNNKFAKEGKSVSWDIVVSNDVDTLWAGGRIVKKWQAKWVFDSHEHFTEVPELRGKNIKRFIWHTLTIRSMPHIDLAMTVSDSLAGILSKTYKNPFHCIPNVPFKQHGYSSVEKKNIILYQGALNKGRGLELAIKAMHQIDGLELHLAGEGDLSNSLRKLVEKEKLEDVVIFHGRLDPVKLKEITATARLGLNLLSDESLSYYYSLSNKFFDYAQAGVPSINMDFPEYRRLVDQYHCGILIPSLKMGPYVNAVKDLMENKGAYEKLQEGAAQLAKDYNWEAWERALIDLYNSLLEE